MIPSLDHDHPAAVAAPLPPNPSHQQELQGMSTRAERSSRVFPEDVTLARTDNDPVTNHFARSTSQKFGVILSWMRAIPYVVSYAYGAVCSTFGQLRAIAANDRRKIIHAFKVALALIITALYTLFIHTEDFVGHNGIWAIMSVVVIFEFTTGATYCKGLNRVTGTFFAGVLVLGISQLAEIGGAAGYKAVACIAIFFVGVVATFLRFVPKMKARYDYGLLVFLLTFSLLMISTNSSLHPVEIASSRLYMITVGCSVSLFTTTFIYPIWAGDELHELTSKNFSKLAESLEETVEMYFDPKAEEKLVTDVSDATYKKYNSLFTSKSHEDSLANFATWEPPHGDFNIKYPWGHYIKVGTALRHCSYTAMALHGCLTSKSKAPIELRRCFEKKIYAVSKEINKVITEVGNNLKRMQQNKPASQLLSDVNQAAFELQRSIQRHSTLFVNIRLSDTIIKSKAHRLPIAIDTDNFIPWSGPLTPSSPTEDPIFEFDKRDRIIAHSGPLTCTFDYNMESANNFSLATFVFLLLETTARLKHVVDTVEQLGIAAKFRAHSKDEESCHHTIDIQ